MKTGTGKVVPGHNHIFTDIAVQVIMTHTEATPGHDIRIITTTLEVAHDAHTPHTENTEIDPNMTHHTDPTMDHPHIEVPQPTTPEIEVDLSHIHSTNPPGEIHRGQIHIPADYKAKQTLGRTLQCKWKIHTWTITALMTIPATQERKQII